MYKDLLIKKLRSLSEEFNINNIDDYKRFIDLINLIVFENEEEDRVILDVLIEICNNIKIKNSLPLQQQKAKEYLEQPLFFQKSFHTNIFEPLNNIYNFNKE